MSTTIPTPHASAPPVVRGKRASGVALEMQRDFLAALARYRRDHGDVVQLSLGPVLNAIDTPQYAAFHPDGVQAVLTTRGTFEKGTPVDRSMAASLGLGLLTTTGPTWVRQKRTLQPLFTRQSVERWDGVIAEESAAVARRWCATGDATRVDLNAEMTGYALQAVGRTLFGQDLVDLAPDIVELVPPFNEWTLRKGLNPLAFPRTWPTPENRRMLALQRRLYGHLERIVADRRASGERNDDLVSLLLDATDPETGAPIDHQEILDQLLVFLAAGHDTTATALTFALHLLGHHPEIQDAVLDEVQRVCGDDTPTAAHTERLTYTTAVVREAMRLYPSAYVTGRLVTEDVEIGGFLVPGGSRILISPWVTHRHPEIWDEPERFDPERWTPEREKERHRYAWFPFGGGARHCIGSHLALLEEIIGVATLVRAVSIRSLSTDPALETGITLIPAEPVPAEVTPR